MSGTIADWERNRFSAKTADEIAALPEIEEPAHTAPVAPDIVRSVLLERTYSGLTVEIVLMLQGDIAVRVTEGEKPSILQPIEGKDAFDAFNHPYCYLPAS